MHNHSQKVSGVRVATLIALSVALLPAAGLGQTAYKFNPSSMPKIAEVDERFQSYNIEAIQVTGGRFWKPFQQASSSSTPSKIDFAPMTGNQMADMFVQRPPADLSNKRLRMLAKALGPAYLRMSGSWQNATYFQNSDSANPATPPDGFKGVMTRRQLAGVVDFAKNAQADLVTSFAASMGTRDSQGNWKSNQAQQVLDFLRANGESIAAAEFMNEPTLATNSDVPKGYGPTNYAEDVSRFKAWLKAKSPDTIFLGPGGEGEGVGWHQPQFMHRIPSEELLKAAGPTYDAYSFHFYSAISSRCSKMLGGGVKPEEALLPNWFAIPDKVYAFYAGLRDKYEPGKPIWVTETGQAACGGDAWAATYLDTFRYLNELGALAKHGVKVVAHNTLAETDYALIDDETFAPRPDYWGALLWRRLMGTIVLDPGPSPAKNLYLYSHCLRGVSGGVAILAINPGDNTTSFSSDIKMEAYQLTSPELQSKQVDLNGSPLHLTSKDQLPAIHPSKASRVATIKPHAIMFLALPMAGNPNCSVPTNHM